MTTRKENGANKINQINVALKAMPPERRPKHSSTRRSICSVSLATGGWVEATDINGHMEFVATQTALAW